MKDETYKLVCSTCGGTNIQQKAWVNPNSDKILHYCYNVDFEDNWCEDCENNVDFRLIKLENE